MLAIIRGPLAFSGVLAKRPVIAGPRRHLLPRKNPQRLKDAADTKFYYLYLKFIIARAPEGPGGPDEDETPSSSSFLPLLGDPFADVPRLSRLVVGLIYRSSTFY